MRSPRILFLGEADSATALEAAEMVGAMKLFATPPPTLERTLCVLTGSRGSFSFSSGEARPLPFLQTEELLCGESARESPPKSVRNQQIGVGNETSRKSNPHRKGD